MRLDIFLTKVNIGTRKIVRNYIKEGYVTVNDKLELNPAIDVNIDNDIIKFKNTILKNEPFVYYMFNKPAGYITARSDSNKETIFELLSDIKTNSLFPVGRLDRDTEGLLLLTNDGNFDHQIMHPSKEIYKTYFFWAFGELSQVDIKDIESGIKIDDNTDVLTKPSKITIIKKGIYSELKKELSDLNINRTINMREEVQKIFCATLTISEGKKHQVKRMLKNKGCYIFYLKRLSIGNITLDKSLKLGEYRELRKSEIQSIIKNVK